METTTDGRFVKEFDKQIELFHLRSVVLGMGDGSMTTLTIADPEKEGIGDYLKSLPSRHTPSLCDQIVVTFLQEPRGCITRTHSWYRHRLPSEWCGVPVSIRLLNIH